MRIEFLCVGLIGIIGLAVLGNYLWDSHVERKRLPLFRAPLREVEGQDGPRRPYVVTSDEIRNMIQAAREVPLRVILTPWGSMVRLQDGGFVCIAEARQHETVTWPEEAGNG